MTALQDVLTTPDLSNCPDHCVRPAGLAWDSQDRLWFSSDFSGEIFVMKRTTNSSSSGNSTSGSGGNSTAGSGDDSAGSQLLPSQMAWVVTVVALAMGLFLA